MKKLAIAVLMLLSVFQLQAEEKVELKGVHLCCNGCVKAIDKAVQKTGANSTCDKKKKTVVVTAKDAAAMKKALGAVASSGYYGSSEGEYQIKQAKGSDEMVSKIALGGFHNCCKKCTTGMTKAVESVSGVKKHSVASKKRDFTVEGNFKVSELLNTINEHGFSVSVQ